MSPSPSSQADFRTTAIGQALGLETRGELVSVVGGGGKSALLFGLGATHPGYTVLTTTTRIFASQTDRADRTVRSGTPELDQALEEHTKGLLVIGEVEGDKALGVPVEEPGAWLAREGVDCVVVEADGSRMLPAKAPAEHEPVVPAETTCFVVVAGIDALTGTIGQTCHRPERVAALLGVSQEEALDPAQLARLLGDPLGGRKGAPAGARVAVILNKVETAADWRLAREVARACLDQPGIERVVLGALEPSLPEGEREAPGFEVWLAGEAGHS